MKSVKYLSIALIFLIISSCSKYEEGPAVSLRSKEARVVNDWEVVQVTDLENGDDITDLYEGNIYTFNNDGVLARNRVLVGDWIFNNNKERIIVTEPSGITTEYVILRLKENEMWLEEVDEREFRFVSWPD